MSLTSLSERLDGLKRGRSLCSGGPGDRLPPNKVSLCASLLLITYKILLVCRNLLSVVCFYCFFICPSLYDSALPLGRPPEAHGNSEISCLLQSFAPSLASNHSSFISGALLFLPRLALSQPPSDKIKLGQGCQFWLLPFFHQIGSPWPPSHPPIPFPWSSSVN